jgi:DNA-directed RNA polymerase subunit M/transcription elongation factor TFIIS
MDTLQKGQRYRCTACGNLTRFNVTLTRVISYFHHQAIHGLMTPEDEEVVQETVNEVTCTWCGHGEAIEVIEGPDTS